jgi:hypothetical protein
MERNKAKNYDIEYESSSSSHEKNSSIKESFHHNQFNRSHSEASKNGL